MSLILILIDSNQDTVFISGLPDDISEDQLVSHFGSIGVIKVCNWKLKNLWSISNYLIFTDR